MIGRRDLELIIVCGKETKQKNDFYCKISGHFNRDISLVITTLMKSHFWCSFDEMKVDLILLNKSVNFF